MIDDDFFEEEKPLVPNWIYPIILIIIFAVIFLLLYISEENAQYKTCDKIQEQLGAECEYIYFQRACRCCYDTISEEIKQCEVYKYNIKNEIIYLEIV